MRSTSRLFASNTPKQLVKQSPETRLRKSNLPSLEHFIQRQRAIHLYRDILRRLYSIPPSGKTKRDELIKYAKGEYERHKHVKEIGQIRYLISTGKTEMMGWERMILELAGK